MKKQSDNYLEFVYRLGEGIIWKVEDGIVTVDMVNRGLANTIAQKLFKKPRISHIELDAMGSFIFTQIDGIRSVYEIGVLVSEKFGNEAEPLYERLSVYMKRLEQVGFIIL